jgi:glycosyltransferase involved in cell wall biosynthesis
VTTARKLWLVIPWSPALPAGVSIVVSRLKDALQTREVDCTITVADWNATTLRTGDDGHRRLRFGVLGAARGAGALLRAVIALPWRLLQLRRALHRDRVGAVDFHYVGLDALGIAVLKRIGAWRGTLVLSFHGTDVRPPGSAFERRLWHFLLNTADALTTCSGALSAALVDAHGEPGRGAQAIANGVDATLFRPATAVPRGGRRYVVSVGSYIPRKGHRLLLDAFARLAADHADVSLVIVGQDGPERLPLIDAAARQGLASRVDCRVDLQPDQVAAVVAGATASVQPSLAEPFGIAVIEAGACGVPVIASAVGGHVEILEPACARCWTIRPKPPRWPNGFAVSR